MIVRKDGGRLVVIPQVDHADLSGQFANHWGNDEFSKPEPNLGMRQAASHHDDGWKTFDEDPTLDPQTEKPVDFYQLPANLSLKIHEETIDRARDVDLYARLMISMHRSGLCHERYGTEKGWEARGIIKKEGISPELKRFADAQEAWQLETERKMADDKAFRAYSGQSHLWTNFKLLQVYDRLSLFTCWARSEGKITPTPRSYTDSDDVELSLRRKSLTSLSIHPWPFDMRSFPVHLVTYEIPDREYSGSRDVALELYSDSGSRKILEINVEKE